MNKQRFCSHIQSVREKNYEKHINRRAEADSKKNIDRQQTIIDSATRGQQMIRPLSTGYTDSQREAFSTYQGFIDRAKDKMARLEAKAASL